MLAGVWNRSSPECRNTGGVCLHWQAAVVAKIRLPKTGDSAKGGKGDQSFGTTSPFAEPKAQQSSPVSPSDPDDVKDLTEQEALDAIDCLLRMENDRRPSRFVGNLQPQISQIFAPPPANLAALYYASYVFTRNWHHAAAIALQGPKAQEPSSEGRYVTRQEATALAYVAYRRWFAELKTIGLHEAREEKLDPLSGTGLSWYGTGESR